MPLLDISDHAFVALAPSAVRARADGPCALQSWIPGLALRQVLDRASEGIIWRAEARDPAGVHWVGTAEVWLEPWHDGTVVHVYVRLDPDDGVAVDGRVDGDVPRWREALRDRWRARFLAWRREVDVDRPPGIAAGRDVAPNGQTATP